MGDGVDGVELVLAVEIGVEGVHHHHHFLPVGILRRAEQPRARDVGVLGMPRRIGVDDEGAVHALVHVPLQRQRVAVIEVAAERLGVELVDELLARTDQPGARHAVHARRMDAVEMHRVRMRAVVPEDDPQPLALLGAERRPGHAAVVGPGREHDARRDLDLLVLGRDLEGPQRAPVGQRRDRAGLPVGQHCRRIEAVAGVVDLADRDHRAVGGAVAGRRWLCAGLRMRRRIVCVRRMICLPERAGRPHYGGPARREAARQDEAGGSTARATMPTCRPS